MERLTNKQKLKEDILKDTPDIFENLVNKALKMAEKYHKNDVRFSGEPFILHSLNVARNCALLKLDTNSIIVALLHQCASKRYRTSNEITSILFEIENTFGKDVLNLLNDLFQINEATKMHHKTDFSVLKKYMISGVADIRPTLIKIADILDDSQTLDYIPEEKKKGFTAKIFNIYAPLCEYLNLSEVKTTIEENAFRISKPQDFEDVQSLVEKYEINETLKTKYFDYLKIILDILQYEPRILGRIKSKYSIYKKLEKYEQEGKRKVITNILDIVAFTVIVKTENECYEISHAIQSLCENNPDEFDDYILIPKPNGYRSLHLSVKIPEISKHIWIEIQVLTHEMYYTNTYGPASHIAYKAALQRFVKANSKYGWIEEIHKEIEKHRNLRETERSHPISGDVFKNQIFVETPNGKIIELEKDSTVIDFAYRIHSEIGNSAVAGKVNNLPVKLSHILKTGDKVEVITRKGKTKADIRWLEYAKSTNARRLIRDNVK